MGDQEKLETEEYFKRIPGFELTHSEVTYHAGKHLIHFRVANEDALKTVLRIALKANTSVRAYLDGWDKVCYCFMAAYPDREFLLTVLKDYFNGLRDES